MRKVALSAAGFFLAATLGCGDRARTDLGSTVDTAAVQNIAPAQETGDAAEAPRSYGFEDRKEFAQSVQQRLADLDRQAEELTNQAKSAGGSVSDRALANIRSARRAAERTLGRIDAATADNWDEVRQRVDRAVESLAATVERAYPK